MAQVILALLLIAMAVVALKVAILLLLLAGLIFRTKETVGLIVILALFAGFNAHPGIGLTMLAVLAIIALFRNAKKPPDGPSAPD